MRYVLLSLALLLCCGSALADDDQPHAKPLANVPLLWRPTTHLEVMSDLVTDDMTGTTLQLGKFTDTRQNPTLIGLNHEQTLARPVTTQEDISAFISGHLRAVLQQAGLAVVGKDARLTLDGEISDFSVSETHVYHGVTTLKLELKDGSGQVIWSGTISGFSTHFGRSFKADNYYEALSDSLVDAIHDLLIDPGFHKALAGK